jgi:rhodanese-related sulfurtransferase
VARELIQAGWTKARALEGGWNAYIAAGLPVVPRPNIVG